MKKKAVSRQPSVVSRQGNAVISANRRCRIGCFGLREEPWHLLCPTCWGKLPLHLRDEVYAAYKSAPGNERHTTAIKACLAHLVAKDAQASKGAKAKAKEMA